MSPRGWPERAQGARGSRENLQDTVCRVTRSGRKVAAARTWGSGPVPTALASAGRGRYPAPVKGRMC